MRSQAAQVAAVYAQFWAAVAAHEETADQELRVEQAANALALACELAAREARKEYGRRQMWQSRGQVA